MARPFGDMDLGPGGALELVFKYSELAAEKSYPDKFKAMENGHHSHGKCSASPPHLIAFTWGNDGGESPSEVTFELAPRDGKVLLTITHRRLKDRVETAGIAGGWHAHLGILEDRLSGREPRGFWSFHAPLAAEYDRRLPPFRLSSLCIGSKGVRPFGSIRCATRKRERSSASRSVRRSGRAAVL